MKYSKKLVDALKEASGELKEVENMLQGILKPRTNKKGVAA